MCCTTRRHDTAGHWTYHREQEGVQSTRHKEREGVCGESEWEAKPKQEHPVRLQLLHSLCEWYSLQCPFVLKTVEGVDEAGANTA